MPTNRRRRLQPVRAPLRVPMRVYLLTGSYEAATAAREPGSRGFGGGVFEVLCSTEAGVRARWFDHRAELLAAAHPGKPWAWFAFEHPERQPAAVDEADALEEDDADR
jgi:hypothetical protein